MLCMSWMRSSPIAQLEPGDCAQVLVHQRRILLLHRHAGADRAAADAEIAQVVGGLVRRVAAPRSIEPAYAVNSWPSRIGIASCRCVRPAFTMWSNSLPFAASASRSASNALRERRRAARDTTSRMFVGIVSFVLCAMFT